LAGEISPGVHTVIGPSTGNFGIGVAYVSHLKGYPAIVIMPEGMSQERYARIRHYGGELDLTPGSESDVILVLERTEFYKKDPKNKVAQGSRPLRRITVFHPEVQYPKPAAALTRALWRYYPRRVAPPQPGLPEQERPLDGEQLPDFRKAA